MIPDILHNLKEHDQVDKIYESLQQDDYSEVVLAALSVLTKTGQMPKIGRETKCEIKSTSFRKKGNDKYQYRNYRTTLMYYNRAILFAPENSKALMLGYSNRSALLYAIKAYKACLNDIDICFNMGCTDQSLADKLAKRRRECYRNILRDDKRLIIDNTFFKFDVKRNPQIPCTILDVGVVKNTNKLKIVAARDIKVGTVVAQETAYVCKLGFTHEHLACFYCHKFDLNLIPCDRCCEVMFCSETCKVRCNKEFHDIECQIMHCIKFPQTGPLCKMNIKAAIKMRQKCSSWKEFTEASKNIGVERMERSSVNEIYDVNNKFSLLCLDNDLHFLYGELFNSSIFTAIVIYYLLEVPSFFPVKQEDKDEAIQAFARVMVNLCLFCRPLEIINHTIDAVTGILKYANPNFGWFSFTGKLKHCCDANLLVLGLNNQVSLLAIKPINKGDELTISYRGHYFERTYWKESTNLRPLALFSSKQILCNCRVCVERWSHLEYRNQQLNNEQQEVVKSCFANENASQMERLRNAFMFKKICSALTALQDAPATKEYLQLFMEFRRFTAIRQVKHTDNTTLL